MVRTISPFSHMVGESYGRGRVGSIVISRWCGKTGLGAVVLSGTIVHIVGRPWIGGDRTTHGRRLPISGSRNPSDRSTRTIVPGCG